MTATQTHRATPQPAINGIDPAAVRQLVRTVDADPSKGATHWRVVTRWTGGAVSQTAVTGCTIGGKDCPKDYSIRIDEPVELGGTNTAPNPQETLLAALNACMTVGYVALCTLHSIKLDSLEIETAGDIDLRGFLGLDDSVIPGYESLDYTVRIKGDGSEQQFAEIHKMVQKTSPNFYNLSHAVALNAKLVVA